MRVKTKMIYLDNAATTHKKPHAVIRAVKTAVTKLNANPGRGGHNLSIAAGSEVYHTREILNRVFNGYGENSVYFVENCTEALNLAILGYLKRGDHVIATYHEHNSVLRPLTYLQANGVEVSFIKPKNIHRTAAEDIEKAIKSNTKMVIVSHISNVLPSVADIYAIGRLCKEKNIAFLVDAAQSAGHLKIDMQKAHIDFLALASHKGLFGIAGASALLSSGKYPLVPIKYGGTGTNSQILTQDFEPPEVYESGTKSLPAIMALGKGAEFIEKRQKKIEKKTKDLSSYLLSNMPENVKVYSKNEVGVISFNIGEIPSTDVASHLNKKGIAVRAGFHCAPLAHELIGTSKQGAVRVSMSYFTKKSELKRLIKELKVLSPKP